MFSEVRRRAKKVGQPPGSPVYTGNKKTPTSVTVVLYNQETVTEKTGTKLSECLSADKFNGVTWVNVEGLSNVMLINELAERFHLHPLTVEDILNVEQRPKVEEFEGYIFITLKGLLWQAKSRRFSGKQISLILGKDFVLSFQELDTTLFDRIRTRLYGGPNQRLREQGSDYLVYRLLDAIVDEYFVVLEELGDEIEVVEERVIDAPIPQTSRNIYRLKRQLLLLRKVMWPMREAISHLLHIEESFVKNFTRIYLRDVYDHTIQAVDTLEIFRDVLSGLLDMYLSSITNRLNEVMKILTIISTIFIPITAIASIYGMNFENLPFIHSRWGYVVTLFVMLLIAVLMLIYFRRKRWI